MKTVLMPLRSNKIAYCGIFASLAIILGYLERLIPIPIIVPGVKLGLSNIIILITLYRYTYKEALFIMLTKVLVVGFLFTSFSSIMYSLSGGLVSLIFMYFGKKVNIFSIVGVSILGSVFHNIGQMIVAVFIVSNIKLLYYVPVITLLGISTGFLTGILAFYCLILIKKQLIHRKHVDKL